jgi:hypothetical protein
VRHAWPQFLPDGHHFLYLRVSGDPNTMGIYIGSTDAKPEQQSQARLLATNRQAYYAASPDGGGYLVFLREGTLMAQGFDTASMQLIGDAVPIAEGVDSFAAANYGLFSVSDTGTLVYRTGAAAKLALTWVDERGNSASTLSELGEYANARLSPDGTRVAVAVGQPGLRDIWILDVARGTSTRLTFDPANDDMPVWSPSGDEIVFSSTRGGPPRMYLKPSNGSGEERLLTDTSGQATSWSKDGRFLLFTYQSATTANDIWALPDPGRTPGESKPISVLATQFAEFSAEFSPDGRWIAYMSVESGMPEVYVRPFSPDTKTAGSGAKWLISKGSGVFPRWRADGRQLFYSSLALQFMAVDIDTSTGFQAGTPRRLFATPPPFLNLGWDVGADGKRFLFSAAPSGARATPFTVVLNWMAGLKQ